MPLDLAGHHDQPALRVGQAIRTRPLASSYMVFEVHEHQIDGAATVFYFARVYADDRSSGAAYDRARAGISAQLNTSVFRAARPADGRHSVVCRF